MTSSDTTYFLALLNGSAIGPVCLGQYGAHISYVFRPRSRSNGTLNSSLTILPKDSSEYGTVQPPYLKPPEVSSSGPPGACITPSRLTIIKTTIFLIS